MGKLWEMAGEKGEHLVFMGFLTHLPLSVWERCLCTDDLLDLFSPHSSAGLFSVELVCTPVPCKKCSNGLVLPWSLWLTENSESSVGSQPMVLLGGMEPLGRGTGQDLLWEHVPEGCWSHDPFLPLLLVMKCTLFCHLFLTIWSLALGPKQQGQLVLDGKLYNCVPK